jgi:hypothetical protein
MVLMVTPPPKLSVVFPLPALLNVAVSPVPGTSDTLQSAGVAQFGSVVPFHVALAANVSGEASKIANKTKPIIHFAFN